MVLLCKKIIASVLKKGKQKGRVDEADISCLPHQPAASCGLDGQHQLEMPSHNYRRAKKYKLRNALLKHTEVATHACSVVYLVHACHTITSPGQRMGSQLY